jgi:hypothetical protein
LIRAQALLKQTSIGAINLQVSPRDAAVHTAFQRLLEDSLIELGLYGRFMEAEGVFVCFQWVKFVHE